MPLAEGVSARITVKPYADGLITPGAGPDPTVAPGNTGGQILRRVSSSLTLSKDTYQSAEINSHRQLSDFRHGVRRVNGGISGELSPLTYEMLFEAALRGTWDVTAVSISNTDLTSIAADSTTSTLIAVSGDPVALGLRVGDVVRLTGASEVTNNGVNFTITSFSGASNRTIHVYPAPTTMAADSAFTMAGTGGTLIIPASGHVSRKFAFEIWNQDIDVAQLFTECRVGGFNVQLPPTGIATVEFTVMGRDGVAFEAGSAPFFTAPTAETTTGLVAAVNGLLQVNGVTRAVVTGANIQLEMNPEGTPVIGSDLVPEIFLGRSLVTGQMTALFEDMELINAFIDEDEISLLIYLTTSSSGSSDALTFYLPRIKLGGASVDTSGEAGQVITVPFTALKASTGDATTIRITDTAVVA
jgi:Phage tail tube protein